MLANRNQITLKSISKIIEENKSFIVKSYQRGYKWTELQVGELLDDINEFEPDGSNYYCLQPVVVNEEKNVCELIDGQQRITTIYIILSYLSKEKFNISYQTRHSSEAFLTDFISNNFLDKFNDWNEFVQKINDKDNIDNYHFFQAYQKIKNWFQENSSVNKINFHEKLINTTKVIWYDIKEANANPIAVFTRLNNGKISLTNAELIKALFLKSDSTKPISETSQFKQNEIAQEWDRIENALHNNELWSFLNKDPDKTEMPTRIDFIFKMLAPEPKTTEDKSDEFYTYRYYSKIDLQKENTWEKVKKSFNTLNEWFEEDKLYHLIGYIVTSGFQTIKELLDENISSKKIFSEYLQELIKSKLNITKEELSQLQYGSDNQKITRILLLFNIQTILNSDSNIRFPFDKYKANNAWSLEHIHAQNSKQLDVLSEMESWYDETTKLLNSIFPSEEKKVEHSKIITSLQDWKNSEGKTSDDAKLVLKNLQKKIVNYIGDKTEDEDIHGIENLALIDKNFNSSLSNDIFPDKRNKIIQKDEIGSFIPIATKNVFLKYYSKDVSQMNIWSKEDRNKYFEKMEEALTKYFNK